MAEQRRDVWLLVIGIGKLFKVAALVTAGVLALTVLPDPHAVQRWVWHLGLNPGSHWVHQTIERASGMDHHTVVEIAAAMFVYAGLFAIEGTGLVLRKRWAEYFTIVITGSFVPIEVYEIVRHFSAGKVVGTALNVAAVVYLVWHLRHTKGQHETRARASRSSVTAPA